MEKVKELGALDDDWESQGQVSASKLQAAVKGVLQILDGACQAKTVDEVGVQVFHADYMNVPSESPSLLDGGSVIVNRPWPKSGALPAWGI